MACGLSAPHAPPQFGVDSFFLKDPDDHTIEVHRVENPEWKG